MKNNLHGLNIIDLISEKHIVLRRAFEERWAKTQDEVITHTEGMLLAKISMEKISIAEVARQANVSRQAMFKCARKLEERGYLKFIADEENGKHTVLTPKGELYCQRSQALKEEIEKEIEEILGQAQLERLKQLLESKWYY